MIRVTLADLNAPNDVPPPKGKDPMDSTDYSVAIAWVITALTMAGVAVYALEKGGDNTFGGVLCIPGVIVCLLLAWSERPARQQPGSTTTNTTRE